MAREIQREAFYRFRPTYSYSDVFTRAETPALRALCQASGGGNGPFNQAWLRGAGRFTEEFERSALAAFNANVIRVYLFIDDPWKLTGYAREELSEGTFQAAWDQTRRVTDRAAAERLGNIMGIVERHGMMTPTQFEAAKWLSGGKLSGGRRFSSSWSSFIFGNYAQNWSDEDLSWLIGSQATPDELLCVVYGLIGAEVGIRPPANGLDFKLIRLVLEEGIAVEYVREISL